MKDEDFQKIPASLLFGFVRLEMAKMWVDSLKEDPRDDPESEWYDPRHIYYTDEDIKNATS